MGGNDEEGERLAFFDELRRPVLLDQVELVAPLARSVQEKHERPGIFLAVILGQIEQVLQADFDIALEGMRGLRAGRSGCGRRFFARARRHARLGKADQSESDKSRAIGTKCVFMDENFLVGGLSRTERRAIV